MIITTASPLVVETADRPTLASYQKGHWLYDKTLSQPMYWDGSTWKNALNLGVPGPIGGTTPAAGTFTTLTGSTSVASPKITLGVQGAAHGFLNSNDGLYINTNASGGAGAFEIVFGKGRSGTSGGTPMFSIDGSQDAVYSQYGVYVYTTALPFTSATNYERAGFRMNPNTAAEVVAETAVTGGDNLDVSLIPAGTGKARFGTHSAIASETVTGYITIKDAGGTLRKLAVVS